MGHANMRQALPQVPVANDTCASAPKPRRTANCVAVVVLGIALGVGAVFGSGTVRTSIQAVPHHVSHAAAIVNTPTPSGVTGGPGTGIPSK